MSELVGREVGRYRITRVLGEGGMGTVYEGVQAESGASVAIKVLSERFARDRELLDRFFSEARATNVIAHENIVKVHDLAQLTDGRPYIVMELLAGKTLRAFIDGDEPLPVGGVLDAAIAVLAALGAAHARGIVHRDIKPDNIFITAKGRAKVLDFGVAKLSGAHALARTETGVLLGTPEYMPPEQITDGTCDARSDLYALGIVLFEALTGRRPFDGASDFEVMRAHVEREPPLASSLRGDLPPRIDDVIGAALAKRPGERFASATAMANALRHLATNVSMAQWRSLVPGGRLTRPRPPSSPQLELPPSGPRTLPTVVERPSARRKPKRRGPLWAAAGIAIAGAAGAVIAMQLHARDEAPVVAAVPAPPLPPPDLPPPSSTTVEMDPESPAPANDDTRPSWTRPVPHTAPKKPVATTDAPPPDAAPVAKNDLRMVSGYALHNFDWVRFVSDATAIAREEAGDAALVSVFFGYVSTNGAVSAVDGDVELEYQSKSASKTACAIRVKLERGGSIAVTRRAGRCDETPMTIPRCPLKEVRARTRAAMPKSDTHPTSVRFADGLWNVRKGGEDATINDACQAPLQRIARTLWPIETGTTELATLGTNAFVLSRMIAADTQLTGVDAEIENGAAIEYDRVSFTYHSPALAREGLCVLVQVGSGAMTASRSAGCARKPITLPKCGSIRAILMKLFNDHPDAKRISLRWDGSFYKLRVRKRQGEDVELSEAEQC